MRQWAISGFVPQDRLAALSFGTSLPQRARGAVLFADIVGFTPLTKALVGALGEERGAEEVTLVLNRVFAALVEPAEACGGSVVAFAGDALICWFDGDDGLSATAAAFGMCRALEETPALELSSGTAPRLDVSVAIAVGDVTRLLLGDPSLQVVEALAGAAVESLEAAQQAAHAGEVVLDAEAAEALSGRVEFSAMRESGGRRCAVASRLLGSPPTTASPPPAAPGPQELKPWVPQVVFDRLAGDQEGLLPGIRPAVALFAAVDDIEMSSGDEGAARVSAFVGRAQSVLTRFGGMLVDVTTGDKGVYLFGAFGVPAAHGDDLLRAVSAAEELREPGIRIGLASGSVYAGVYGAPSRCCYGIKGTTVNVAARLMQEAGSGKVLLSGGFGASTARRFEIRPLPPLFLKGFTDPVPTSELVGPREERGVRLPEPQYTVPIVGRRSELRRVLAAIRLAAGGQGQVLGISGDPGLGKSRLLAETIQLATAAGFEALVGAASSFGTAVPYLAWRPLWRQFFGLEGDASPSEQAAELERFLAGIDHALPAQVPLLGPLLGLAIPDNETTGPLPPPARKKLIGGLLLRCVAERAARRPLLLALEDCHWFDSVSLELLADVRAQLSELPVVLVATYRPPGLGEPHVLGPEFKGGRGDIELAVFDEEDASELIHLKLGELFGIAGEASPELVQRITERAQGNPFYLEELLNHLSDLGIDPSDARAVQQVELPTTLHSLILDRLDRLTPDEQLVLKAAAVAGRRFRADWLRGAYPELGTEDDVRKALAALARFDLIAQDAQAADVAYLFKHVATWEAAYQSLPFEARETSHERLASYLEEELGDAAPVELLAQHYGRSRNRGKELEYVLPAGEHAVGQGAYREASQYLGRGLEIVGDLEESPERAARELALQLGLGGVMLTTHGQGAPEAKLCFDRAMELTAEVPRGPELVRALFGLWTYYLFRGDMRPTDDLARQILGEAQAIAQPEALLQAHFAVSATVYWLGDFAGTVHHADEVARLYDPQQAGAYVARYAQNPRVTAAADAAWAEWIMGRTGAARRRSEETVAHARELGHEFVLTIALQIPAFLSLHMGDVATTAAAAQEWLDSAQRVGNPVYVGLASACLGWAKAASGETEEGLGMLGGVRQGFLDQGVEVVDPLLATAQADAHLRCGQAAAGLELLEHAIPRVREKHQVAYLAEQHRLRGELHLVAGGERDAAEDDFRRALAIADEQGAHSYSLRAAMSLTRLLRGGSREEEAEALLRSLRALVPDGRDTPDVQLADAILAAGSSPTLEAPIR